MPVFVRLGKHIELKTRSCKDAYLVEYDGNFRVYGILPKKVADNKGAENIFREKGAVIVADRFYNDFPMLSIWDSKGVFFVIRHKENSEI